MANKEMKTLTMGGNTYEIVDKATRDRVDILEDNQLVMTDNGNGEVNLTTTNISMIDGSLSESSTNAIQNRAVTAAINNHTTKINDNANNIEVQKARIDTFTTLASGSTTGDAELIDIRVKADGTTATSAGNAVREQISELKGDLFNSSILIDAMRFENNVFTENKIILTDGTFRDNPSYLLSEWIPINSANIFVYDHLVVATSVLSVAYYDSNKTFISGVQGIGVWQNGETTADITGYVRFSTQLQYLNYASIYLKDLINSRIKSADSNLLNGKNEYYFSKNTQINRYNLTINDIKGDSFGDSITKQYGTSESDTWQGSLKNILGCESIDNHGVDGSTVSTIASNGMCTDERINALTENTNFVIVMGGINDWAQNVPIGDKAYYNTNTSTFFGACNVMFRKLISAQHSRRVIALGCTFAKYPNRYNFDDNRGILNNLGLSSIDYSNAMIESAKLNGIEHYNIGANLCVNESNIADYFNDENGTYFIHPNEYGRMLIASYIANVIG